MTQGSPSFSFLVERQQQAFVDFEGGLKFSNCLQVTAQFQKMYFLPVRQHLSFALGG